MRGVKCSRVLCGMLVNKQTILFGYRGTAAWLLEREQLFQIKVKFVSYA